MWENKVEPILDLSADWTSSKTWVTEHLNSKSQASECIRITTELIKTQIHLAPPLKFLSSWFRLVPDKGISNWFLVEADVVDQEPHSENLICKVMTPYLQNEDSTTSMAYLTTCLRKSV